MAFGRPPTFQEYVAQRMAQALTPEAATAIPLPTQNAALPFGPAGVPGNAQQLAEPGRQAANLPAPVGPVASPLELIAALQAAAATPPPPPVPGSGVAVVGTAPVGSSLPVRVRSTPGAGAPAFSPMVSIPNPQQGPPLPPGGVPPAVAPILTPQESQAPSSPQTRAITNQRSRAVLDQQNQLHILQNNADGARRLQQQLIDMGMDETQAAQTAAALVIRRGQRGQATTVKDVESGQLNMDLADLAAGNAPDLASDVTRAAVDYLAAAPGEISQGVRQAVGPLVDVTKPVVGTGFQGVRDVFGGATAPVGEQVRQVGNVPVSQEVQLGGANETPQSLGGGGRVQQFQNDPASLALNQQSSGTVAQGPTVGSVAGQLGGAAVSGAAALGGAAVGGVGDTLRQQGNIANAATGVDAGDVGHAVETVIAASDIPRQYVIDGLGTLSYYLAKAGLSTSENRADIESAYENGYMSPAGVYTPPGGRAVWEATIAAMPDDWPVVLRSLFHITTDTLTDPLTYLGTVAKAGDALEASARAAQAAGDVNKAAALNAAAQLLKAPDLLFNKSVEKGFDRGRELSSRLNPFTPQTEIGNATEEVSGARQQVNRARAEVEAAGEGGQPVPGNAGPMGGGGPTQPPLTPQPPGPTSGTAPTGGGRVEGVFGQGPVVMTPEQQAAYRAAQQQGNVAGSATRLQQDELIGGRNAGPVTTLTPQQTQRVMTPPVVEEASPGAVATITNVEQAAPPAAPVVRTEPGTTAATIVETPNEAPQPGTTAREAAQGVPTPEPDGSPAPAPEPPASAVVPTPARPQDVLPADRAKGSMVDKNREARRQAMEQLPPDVVSLPKQDLGYLDPSYVPLNPASPPPFGEVMAFRVAPQHPEAAPTFWEEYTKLADAHMKADEAMARSAAGPGGVREIRQTPRRVAERAKFQLERAALVDKYFKESWVDGQEWARDLPVIDPQRSSGYDETIHRHVFGADIDQPGGMTRFVSDVFSPHTLPNGRKETDALIKQRVRPLMRAMVEAAGIGPDDAEAAERGLVAARQARYFLRQADAEPLARQLLDGESPKRLAGELSDLRKTAYGEGALSQRKTSVAARERAKRQAVTVERIGKQQQWLVGTNLPADQQGLLRKDADGFILDLPGQESAPVPKEAAGNATKAKKWAQEQIADRIANPRQPGFPSESARRGMAVSESAAPRIFDAEGRRIANSGPPPPTDPVSLAAWHILQRAAGIPDDATLAQVIGGSISRFSPLENRQAERAFIETVTRLAKDVRPGETTNEYLRRIAPELPTDAVNHLATGMGDVSLGVIPPGMRRQMEVTDALGRKANALIDRLQPRPIEASAEPAFVPERTEADRLFNRGGIDDETRDTLNMEIRTPVLAKTSRGDTYDKGLRERVNPKKETGPAAAPEVQQTLGGRETGFTTVLDAIDTLVAAGVDDAQINTIVGRLVAEARGVNVARALKLPETGWERTLAKIKKGWGGWRAFIRENTQFGIHRIASGLVQDAIGDGWTAQAFGDWRTALEQFNPGLFKASVVDVRAGNLDALMRAGKLDYLTDLGETLPHDLIAFTEGRSESALSGPTIAGKATFQVGNRTIRPLSFLASEYARDMRTAGDRLRRILAFDHVMREEMRGASERFDVALVKRAEAKGVDPAQWRQAITDQADAAGKGYLFSPEDIRRATGDEALARAWRSEIKQARKRGVAVVNKMYFTYKQTELDRVLSQVTFFHYWMSRATVMHAEMALRHPRLIATYWRFWQGLQQEADRQGYPDTLKTYIRFMGDTKGGWYAYADPLSLIIPFTMFREMDRDHAAWYERIGLYINPMVMGAAAAMGMTDSIPDLLGTRGLENRIMPVWNLLQAHGVVPSDGVPDQGVIQRITQAVVGLMNEGVRSVIPPARQFEPFSATGYIHDQLITLIDARAEQLYGPRAGWGQDVQDQVHAAYASLDVDPRKNPLSAWAVDQWAGQSVKGAALSWFVPVRNRLAVRDAQTQAASAGYDALFDADPDTNPTPEQQAAMDARQRARSTDPALVDLSQQYQGIGTPAQQTASKLWSAVAYAGNEDQIPTIEDLNGDRVLDFGQGSGPLPERITLDDLMAMDSKERMAVADRMVARRGLTADLLNYRHQRDAFKEANPEIQPFLDYQKVAYDYPGGVMAFANDLRRVSPNFNAYLTEQEARGPITQNDVTGVDAFIAQRGDQPDVYGQPPQAASDPSAVPGVQTLTGAGGGSSSASEDTTPKPKKKKEPKTPAEKDIDAINKDLDQIAEWQAAVNTVLSQGGNTIPYDQLEQFSRAAVDQELAANGIRKPSVGSTTRLYLLWRASQEPGADTSVEAFVRYLYDTKNQPSGDGA